MRSRLRNILYLHGLASYAALPDQRLPRPDRMSTHRRDKFVTHVAARFEHEFAPGVVVHINRATAGVSHVAGVLEDRRQDFIKFERRADYPADLAERPDLIQ